MYVGLQNTKHLSMRYAEILFYLLTGHIVGFNNVFSFQYYPKNNAYVSFTRGYDYPKRFDITALASHSTAPVSSSSVKSNITPKYPTERGSIVDSRKIIAEGEGKKHLTAVRMSHILFLNEELATMSFQKLQKAEYTFSDLCAQISLCDETKKEGGNIGWVSCSEGDGTNLHLDEILPFEARSVVMEKTNKPGDIVKVKSNRGFHLVQIVDVMVDVKNMVFKKQRSVKKREKIGILRGALASENENTDLTYKIETMGCQMNIADSERIEGQLQNLGIDPFPEDADKNENPDIVILNTCSIRDHAEQKVYSYVGPHAKRKREGEDVTIIVAGCVAQQEGEQLLRRVPEIDLVMGPQVSICIRISHRYKNILLLDDIYCWLTSMVFSIFPIFYSMQTVLGISWKMYLTEIKL